MGYLYFLVATHTKNHKPIQTDKHQNQLQMYQHSSTALQTCLRPQHPAPQQSGIYSLTCKTCNLFCVGQTNRDLKTRFQEHIRYIKTNNPHSAYAQHILHIQHEYGTLAESMTLLEPLQNESMLLPFEQLHVQSLHQAGTLISEKYLNDPNPLFQLTFSHPSPTRHKTEPVNQQANPSQAKPKF